jgi:inosine/xanthosine triphosphatase
MLVAVGSKNPAKVKGVVKVFSQYFPKVDVQPIDASIVTRLQPHGLEEILDGATKRARFAKRQLKADFGVGVEAGIVSVDSKFGFLNQQFAAVTGRGGKVSFGTSAGFALPSNLVKRMIREGRELEYYAEKITGVKRIAEKEGIVHYLTRGFISRTDLTVQCVTAALVPWLNTKLYCF